MKMIVQRPITLAIIPKGSEQSQKHKEQAMPYHNSSETDELRPVQVPARFAPMRVYMI